jgi:predicted NBD/HSP70 family sugar kinase
MVRSRTMLYFGGERTVTGGIVVGGESLSARSVGGADFARIPVAQDGGGVQRLDAAVSLAALLKRAGLRSGDDADVFVDRFPREALASLLSAVAEGDDAAASAVTSGMVALSQAIDAAIAIVGADVVVLDGYLGVLGTLIAPSTELPAEVVALPSHPSRVVDGAVFAARDARLAQPSNIRNKS